MAGCDVRLQEYILFFRFRFRDFCSSRFGFHGFGLGFYLLYLGTVQTGTKVLLAPLYYSHPSASTVSHSTNLHSTVQDCHEKWSKPLSLKKYLANSSWTTKLLWIGRSSPFFHICFKNWRVKAEINLEFFDFWITFAQPLWFSSEILPLRTNFFNMNKGCDVGNWFELSNILFDDWLIPRHNCKCL